MTQLLKTEDNYWLRRYIQEKATSLKSQQAYEEELNSRLSQLLYIYNKDLKRWYGRFASNLGIPADEASKMLKDIEYKSFEMTLSEFRQKAIDGGYEQQLNTEYFKSQIARLKQLKKQLIVEATDLCKTETQNFENEMVNEFQHTYLHDIYNMQSKKMQFESNFTTYSSKQLRHVLGKPWVEDADGKRRNFSERIWGSYVDKLPDQLTESVLRSTLTGASYSKVMKEFKTRFVGVKNAHIHRLVVTEMGHVQEEASAQAYKSQGQEKYQYVSVLERRTCDICGHLDRMIFDVKDRKVGVNYPLIHPNCRCTTVPYDEENDDGSGHRWSENGVIDDISFDEWKNKYANN